MADTVRVTQLAFEVIRKLPRVGLAVSEQSAAVALMQPSNVAVTEQSAAVALMQPSNVAVTEQSAAVALFPIANPRRRSGMLIA